MFFPSLEIYYPAGNVFALYYLHIICPSKFVKGPRERRRVRVIWHQAKQDAEVLRQAFSSQRELLIEYNGPQQEASVIYGLLDFTISTR